MGFFDRVANVWKGKVSDRLSQMENSNPEAVYESAVAEREQKYRQLKKAAAGIAQLRDQTREELETSERELAEVMPAIETAVGEGDDDVALILLQQKDTLTSKIPNLQSELAKLESQAAETIEGLRTFKGEIDKLKREKEEMLAQKASAEARIQTQETMSGLSADTDVKALANVRAHIDQMHSDANEGLLDSDGVSMRQKVEQARGRMAESSARNQLEEMKRQMASRKGGDAVVTKTLDAPAPAESAAGSGGSGSTDSAADSAPDEDAPPKRSL